MGDLIVVQHNALNEHIVAVVEPSAYDYTAFAAQTIVAVATVQSASMVATAVRAEVEVVAVPLAVAATAVPDDPIPSHSTSHMFYL